MPYNTGNPVGSTDPRDLYDNAQAMDIGMNSQSHAFTDRLGAQRTSWYGMEQSFDSAQSSRQATFEAWLAASGFEATHLIYVDGQPLTVDRPTQLIDRDGSVYRVKMPASFPVALTGDWSTDAPALVDVGDDALRSDLADPLAGASIVAGAVRSVSNLAELRALPTALNTTAFTYGRDVAGDGAQGAFKFLPGDLSAQVSSDKYGALYVAPAADPSGASGAWVRMWDGVGPRPEWWGRNGTPDHINSIAAPVALRKLRAGATQDSWVLCFGDSHSWGQGAPESENFMNATRVSLHSANIHNLGLMQRVVDEISERRRFNPRTYGAWAPSYSGSILPGTYSMDAMQRAARDPSAVMPLVPVCGKITGRLAAVELGTSTNARFYTPLALGRPMYQSLFREKLEIGLFGARMLRLSNEIGSEFREAGKTEFFAISPNPNRTASGAAFTSYESPTGGVFAEVQISTGALIIVTGHASADMPAWVQPGLDVYVPGYGLARVSALVSIAGGTDIYITSPAGAQIGGTSAVRCFHAGVRLFHPAYVSRAVFRVPMQAPARVAYVAVRHAPGGGTLDLYFTDILNTGGGGNDPALSTAPRAVTSSGWEWGGNGTNVPTVAMPSGGVAVNAKASNTADSFRIDTSPITSGVSEEVIYRMDFGAIQYGDLFLEATGPVEIRGVTLDNNKVVNLAMGGHSVGAWLGDEASFNDGPQDHVQQILDHVPVQPSHVIIQIPFVNEYLNQTPIATFKERLLRLINRFKDHLPGSNNFNLRGVDFLMFTTLRNRELGFGVAVSDPVSYDDYVRATWEFCNEQEIPFVDAEASLMTRVNAGLIDVERLYQDSNHPSDYANELIFDQLRGVLPALT